MNKLTRKTFICSLFLTWFLFSSAITKEAAYTVMVYAQADFMLNSFALKNFNAMTTVGSSENVKIVAQWNQPKSNNVCRYIVNKDNLEMVSSTPRSRDSTPVSDLISFSDFAVKNYPASNYILVLWDHGTGCIDPSWDKLQQFCIDSSRFSDFPRVKLNSREEEGYLKGILFDVVNKTYLNNQNLVESLSFITQNITKKRFVMIGMDACLMSMFEIIYQLRKFSDFFVSSEEVEHAQGWDYVPFLLSMREDKASPEQLSKIVVSSFENFHKPKTQFYTQSAIDLSGIDLMKACLDKVVVDISECMAINSEQTRKMVKGARASCFQLTTQFYIDLHSFLKELSKELINTEVSVKSVQENKSHSHGRRVGNQLYNFTSSPQFCTLKKSLDIASKLIDKIVVANVASKYFSRARGISIYYPTRNAIDSSYFKTQFAKESLWINFLRNVALA